MNNRMVIIFILLNMLLITIGYITAISFGLYILSKNVNEEVTLIIVHTPSVAPLEEETPHIEEPTKDVTESPVPIHEVVKPDPPEPEVVSEDLKVLAQIINAEAGVEPYEGKIAVGNVVINRVNHPQFPDTIKGVVYQKGQFSPVSSGAIHKEPSDESIKAAKEVLNGRQVVADNVLFFYNPEISTSSWIFTREVVTKIGDHSFAL